MKKLFTCTVIVFLMILISGLAMATSNPVCTSSACTDTGTLYLVAANGTTITEVDGVSLLLTRVAPETSPDTDPPGNFWTGTLTFPAGSPLDAVNQTTVNISAVKAPWFSDDPHVFPDIVGTNSAGNPGTLSLMASGSTNVLAYNPTTKKTAHGFGIRGKIYDGATFIGVFHGVLFP